MPEAESPQIFDLAGDTSYPVSMLELLCWWMDGSRIKCPG